MATHPFPPGSAGITPEGLSGNVARRPNHRSHSAAGLRPRDDAATAPDDSSSTRCPIRCRAHPDHRRVALQECPATALRSTRSYAPESATATRCDRSDPETEGPDNTPERP